MSLLKKAIQLSPFLRANFNSSLPIPYDAAGINQTLLLLFTEALLELIY